MYKQKTTCLAVPRAAKNEAPVGATKIPVYAFRTGERQLTWSFTSAYDLQSLTKKHVADCSSKHFKGLRDMLDFCDYICELPVLKWRLMQVSDSLIQRLVGAGPPQGVSK